MIESHLSLLLVVLPLTAAPIIAVLPNGRLPWAVSTIVSWSVFYMAAWQLINVSTGHTISYELGGWAPPWGIEYRIDAANALVALVVSGIAALTLPYALTSGIDGGLSISNYGDDWSNILYYWGGFTLCDDWHA